MKTNARGIDSGEAGETEGLDPQGKSPARRARPEESRAQPSPHIEPERKIARLMPSMPGHPEQRWWTALERECILKYAAQCYDAGMGHAELEAAFTTTPTEGPAQPEVRLNDDGSLDEVVGTGAFHLEQMDANHWWMRFEGGGRAVDLHMHARGKITATFEESATKVPASTLTDPEGAS